MSYPNRPTNAWQSDTASPFAAEEWQRRQDHDHLNLLSIFYYIIGGFYGLYSIGIVGYFALAGNFIGASMAGQPRPHTQEAAQLAAVFMGVGGFMAFLSLVFTGLTIYAGYSIAQRKNLTLIQIIAALHCLNVPFGTALGVCTFIVLGRPTVKDLFDPGYLSRQSGIYR